MGRRIDRIVILPCSCYRCIPVYELFLKGEYEKQLDKIKQLIYKFELTIYYGNGNDHEKYVSPYQPI